jgi:hypothetical protein
MKAQTRLLAVACAVLSCLSAGCTSHRLIASDAREYNFAVEDSQNEILLLNILRARDSKPIYFTGLSSFTGSPTQSLSLSLASTKTFGAPAEGNTRVTSFGPTGTVGTTTTYNVGVLDNKEFMLGISQPLGPETLDFLVRAGWPSDMLLWLLVASAEVIKDQDDVTLFRNSPRDTDQFSAFSARFKNDFAKAKVKLISEIDMTEISPMCMDRRVLVDRPEIVVDAAKAGYVLQETPAGSGCLKFTESRRIVGLCLESSAPCTRAQTKNPSIASRRGRDRRAQAGALVVQPSLSEAETVIMYLRSPLEIVGYLGDLLALTKAGQDKIPHVCPDFSGAAPVSKTGVPLFELAKAPGQSTRGTIEVSYGSERYIVPVLGPKGLCRGSAQTLSLLAYLIGIQKEGDKFPASIPVTVVGGSAASIAPQFRGR